MNKFVEELALGGSPLAHKARLLEGLRVDLHSSALKPGSPLKCPQRPPPLKKSGHQRHNREGCEKPHIETRPLKNSLRNAALRQLV